LLFVVSGATLFMVLSREGAVEGWRQVIGPTDPEKAKEEAPERSVVDFVFVFEGLAE
jgi:nucleoside diphosphate kinase